MPEMFTLKKYLVLKYLDLINYGNVYPEKVLGIKVFGLD